MKTVKLFLTAFAMTAIFTSCQKEQILPQASTSEPALKALPAKPLEEVASDISSFKIHYEVVVHYSNETPLCNAYMVELKDGKGNYIAENQNFIPGISTYHFYDNSVGEGLRVARLILNPNIDKIACPTELFTTPAVLTGRFIEGGSYRFDLYPEDTPKKRVE
jgi:hypothetical protein